MRKLSYVVITLFISIMIITAQTNSYPRWVSEKSSAMKEQIKTDLKLSEEDAASYCKIIADKFATDAAETKKLEGDDAKKDYRKAAAKIFFENLQTAFGTETAKKIQEWHNANQAKFNKPVK